MFKDSLSTAPAQNVRVLWYDVCMYVAIRAAILPLIAASFFFVVAAPVTHADAVSDLEQSIRTVLMRDPHAAGIPAEQIESLVRVLAREASSRGIEPRRIESGTMNDAFALASESSRFDADGSALFSASMWSRWLAVFGGILVLIALVVLSRFVHREKSA